MNSSRLVGTKRLISSTYLKFKRKKFNKQISILLIMAVIVSGFLYVQHKDKVEYERDTRAFKVMVEGNIVGIVRDKVEVSNIITELQNELAKDYNMEIAIHCNTTYVDTHAEDEHLTSMEELKTNIKSNLGYKILAYAITVDGKVLGVLKTADLAKEILNKIKEPYENKKEGSQIEEIGFAENVKIVKKEASMSEVGEPDKVLAILQKGTDEEKIHVVQKGESFWSIANNYNITVEELISANTDKNPELIHPGEELSLIVPKPYISVATIERQTYEQAIKFDTKYEYSKSMYNDETKIKKKGIPGKSKVVARVEKHNGVEVSREILQQTLISEPVAQIEIKGTVQPPPKKGIGIFINPLPQGRLTSRFGMRWGRMHEGIDLAARKGTPIKASDGGVVTFAGWKGSYGYMVEIDHGSGFKTRYAHCNKIYVKKGEKVYQGKTIGAVGNTGRSTGPHVHFEVRKYEAAKNPYSYLGKKYTD